MGEIDAFDRMFRVMVSALSIGTVLLVGLNAREIAEATTVIPAWWTVATVCAIVGPAVATAILVRLASLGALRVSCGVQASAFLVALATLPLVYDRSADPTQDAPWIYHVCVLGATAAAAAFRVRAAWVYVATLLVELSVNAGLWWRQDGNVRPVLDALFDGFYATFCFAIALATMRAGRILDARAAAAVTQARVVAASSARELEDARLHALVHDHVLAALLSIVNHPSPQAVAVSSRKALTELEQDENSARGVDDDDVDQRTLSWRLQAVVTEIAPDAVVRWEGEPSPHRQIPAEVAAGLGEAIREILRNSVQHAAGDDLRRVTRLVRAQFAVDSITVHVLDDGRGFEPSRVAESRLGLRVSVRGRLARIPGGFSRVRSKPGRGTLVEIGWRRP